MLAYLLIICVAFFVVATSTIRLVGEYLFSQKVREEQRVAADFAQRVAASLYARDADEMYALAAEASAENGGRVMVADLYGVVQTDALSEYNGYRLNLNEVASVLTDGADDYGYYSLSASRGGQPSVIRSASGGSDVVGVYAAPIVSGVSGLIGVLVYVTASQDVYENLLMIQRQMLVWLMLVALAVVLLSLFVSRIFTRPIEELNRGIARMAQGDLSTRVTIAGKNEFAQLADAFNIMSEKLETLDKSRNQFVSNASHELKTPLSTMKILVETLLYQEAYDPAMQKEFLGDINREIDRLNGIVGDLLTLVHFDSGKTELRTVKASLDELVSDTARRLLPLAQSKKINMECVVKDKIECLCDDKKLQQVFYNLIDNAIKYTPDGGSVRVDVARNGRKAVIRVADSGIGIPKADQLHIFERFYRVDKARSRVTGGTGLGLAIVKQIVLLHDGSITVSSEEEKGSVFTVELPIVNI